MRFTTTLPILFPLLLSLLFTSTHAATFDILNKCTYTVWAAASPGGGRRLDSGQSWTITVNPGTTNARIWGRTSCTFDANGLANAKLPNNLDYIDISLVDGFNIPMDFSGCRGIQCSVDINGQCPSELKAPGGCNNPCTVFKTNEYCCTDGPGSCGPTTYSKFFKDRCPDAYSYPQDDKTSLFTCPSGTNYKVTFCP
ncbi:Thaumatin-like protein [Vitis vinifera]|uniref:Thaumatin-like protein n=1 Tax=Vitis vinifera TaxID=29760 RepID=A0A438C0F4_VITVI|nr:Thaumatin-like protein [Vitis vinifera]